MRGIAVTGTWRATRSTAAVRASVGRRTTRRALRLLGGGFADRRPVRGGRPAPRRRPLAALGVPFTWLPAPSTTQFDIRYEGEEERAMAIADLGAAWTVDEARAAGRAGWVQVGALTRADFPAEVLSALATGASRSTGRRRPAGEGRPASFRTPRSTLPCCAT